MSPYLATYTAGHSGKLAGLAYFWHKLPKLVGADVSGSYLSTPIEDCRYLA
jgi:hypothetical protein